MSKLPWQITREMFLDDDEVDILLRHVRAKRAASSDREFASASLDAFIVEILLFTGLKTSEFCKLVVSDTPVVQEESVIVVRNKGKVSRTIYVPRYVCELIEKFVGEVRPIFVSDDVDPQDRSQPLVFNERKRPYERTGLYRRVKRILTEAGLGDRASVQLLRHTYGYLAYKRTGGNLLFVQRQLGHAHPMITSVYAQLVDESYEDIADMVYSSPRKKRHRRELWSPVIDKE